MGAYIVKGDILEQMPQSYLIDLTDDEETGLVNDARVDAAIANAEGEADGYLDVRYKTPLSTVPAVVKAFVVDIAIYRLYARREGGPDHIVKRYDDAIKFLRAVSKGEVSLGVETPAPDNPGSEVDIESSARLFDRDKMGGY